MDENEVDGLRGSNEGLGSVIWIPFPCWRQLSLNNKIKGKRGVPSQMAGRPAKCQGSGVRCR